MTDIRVARGPVAFYKHGGPGNHANGSPQTVHGVQGAATVPRVAAAGRSGGFTVDHRTGAAPTSGFAVALPGNERKLALTPDISKSEVESFTAQYRADTWSQWESTPGAHWGGWLDESSGTPTLFYDVSIITPRREDAIALGRHYNQLAVFDLGTFEEIRLDAA